jgi:hypothetical protein
VPRRPGYSSLVAAFNAGIARSVQGRGEARLWQISACPMRSLLFARPRRKPILSQASGEKLGRICDEVQGKEDQVPTAMDCYQDLTRSQALGRLLPLLRGARAARPPAAVGARL